jgi:hypothetical protein
MPEGMTHKANDVSAANAVGRSMNGKFGSDY